MVRYVLGNQATKTFEACSNETCSGIVLAEGVEAIKSSPHGH
jgi:hypothetical protein